MCLCAVVFYVLFLFFFRFTRQSSFFVPSLSSSQSRREREQKNLVCRPISIAVDFFLTRELLIDLTSEDMNICIFQTKHRAAQMNKEIRQKYAKILWILSSMFLARVLGQILVYFLNVNFLPPMSEWYSGLLVYPLLLPTQIAMLYLMYRINTGVMRGNHYLLRRRQRLGYFLLWFSIAYAVFMAVRYFIAGALHTERRWLPPGIIPIVFHWVLAGYLWTLSCLTLRYGVTIEE